MEQWLWDSVGSKIWFKLSQGYFKATNKPRGYIHPNKNKTS